MQRAILASASGSPGIREKDWTASFRQCQPSPKLRQSRRTRLAVDGISARLSGVWARSSPEAAKRGVRDAGLEVGHIPRDHRSAVWSFIASDMSDRSSADLYNLWPRRNWGPTPDPS